MQGPLVYIGLYCLGLSVLWNVIGMSNFTLRNMSKGRLCLCPATFQNLYELDFYDQIMKQSQCGAASGSTKGTDIFVIGSVILTQTLELLHGGKAIRPKYSTKTMVQAFGTLLDEAA